MKTKKTKTLFYCITLIAILSVVATGLLFLHRIAKSNKTPTKSITKDPSVAIELSKITDQKLLSKELDTELANGTIVQIPGTNLTVKIPDTYIPSILPATDESGGEVFHNTRLLVFAEKKMPQLLTDIYTCYAISEGSNEKLDVEPYLTHSYCKQLMATYPESLVYAPLSPGGRLSLKVEVVDTPLSAKEWSLDNVVRQGIKLRDDSPLDKTGTEITLNGKTFYSVEAGCCSAYDQVYLYRYIDTHNTPHLLAFSNTSGFANMNNDHNLVLDKILATLAVSNLKTYTNPKIGISLEYPATYHTAESESGDDDKVYISYISNTPLSKHVQAKEVVRTKDTVQASIEIRKMTKEFFDWVRPAPSFATNTLRKDTVVIDGVQGIKYSGEWSDYFTTKGQHSSIVVVRGNNVYEIDSYPVLGISDAVFSQIVASIKFVD
jgi:hypothetical protein